MPGWKKTEGMSELEAMVDEYVHSHGSSQAWVASQMGMSRAALNAWWSRGRRSPPDHQQLRALARAIRVPYKYVLDAALTDFGYLPIEGGEAHGAAPKTQGALGSDDLESKRKARDDLGLTDDIAARDTGDDDGDGPTNQSNIPG